MRKSCITKGKSFQMIISYAKSFIISKLGKNSKVKMLRFDSL